LEGEEERKELINLIQENNQKLLRIVDDVINISKIEAGKEELEITSFDLNDMLKSVVDTYIPKVTQDVTISTMFAQSSMSISTDLNRLTEVINHLMSNAVKFTSQGKIILGYNVAANKQLRIWVQDTGKGIAPEHLERVFERFFKVDEYIPGAGLGLSICRTMAYSLGGEVGVDSKLGEGSKFWIEIPL
jgi:signal transduction histidine kinase